MSNLPQFLHEKKVRKKTAEIEEKCFSVKLLILIKKCIFQMKQNVIVMMIYDHMIVLASVFWTEV